MARADLTIEIRMPWWWRFQPHVFRVIDFVINRGILPPELIARWIERECYRGCGYKVGSKWYKFEPGDFTIVASREGG